MHETSDEHDFDFLIGRWDVAHRRLEKRLEGCDAWQEFAGTCSMQRTLGGRGNVDDNVIEMPGAPYRAVTLRAFDAAKRLWAIWWLDGRHPHRLDPPLVGAYEDGVGTFFADDSFEGRPIRVRFLWTLTRTASPQWQQSFSADGGTTWEPNWTMRFVRSAGTPRPT